jgi:hypothetical protein
MALILCGSGQIKELTRLMPARIAYWTTLRMIRSKMWDHQALLELMAGDILYTLPPPKDGELNLVFDSTRSLKTGEKQPLAYTTKTGKYDPFQFGHSVLLLVAQWGTFRIPIYAQVIDPKIKGHQNILVRDFLKKFRPPAWCRKVIVEADAGFGAKETFKVINKLGYFYVFALSRTWKTADDKHLRDIARHTNKKHYHRVASYKPNGYRRDYWTYRSAVRLSVLGDVTLVLSKKRYNDPPNRIKLLVTNLPDAGTGEILSHYARRWSVEVTFKELKSGLHMGQMQVTRKEERIQRSIVLPVMAYLLLLRLYGPEFKPGQNASLFLLKRRFAQEAWEDQLSQTETRFRKKWERWKQGLSMKKAAQSEC